MNYQDMEIQAHIQRPDTHNCKITVTAPESLKGVCVDYSDGVINLSYGIIKQTLDITKIPQAAFAPAIIHALDSIAAYQEQNAAPANADGDYVLNMNSEFGDFTVTLEETTGAIKSIEIPSYQVKVTFSTFTPLSEA